MIERRHLLAMVPASLAGACTTSVLAGPAHRDAEAAAGRFYGVLNRALRSGDMSLLAQVVARDAVDHDPVPGMKPGLEGIAEAFAGFRATFGDAEFTIEDVIAGTDRAACRVRVTATHRGELFGVAASGRRLSWMVIDILRFADGGLMAERWGAFDEAGQRRQLGASCG